MNIINNIFLGISCLIILLSIVDFNVGKIKKESINSNKKEDKIKKAIDSFFENKRNVWIIFFILLTTAIISRTFRLDNLMNAYNCDELGTGYDAFCIANYGVDRYLNKFPIYFNNFGGGQSALPIYLTALIGKIFGFSMVTLRIPNTLLSIVAIVMSFFAFRKIKADKFALMFMAIIVSSPWHFLLTRIGLDCNMQTNMTLISISLLLLANKNWHYIIAGVFFGLTLYSYILSVIVIPIFLFILLIYLLYVKRINVKNGAIFICSFLIVSIPIFYFALVSKGVCPDFKGFISISSLTSKRINEFKIKNLGIILLNIHKMLTNDEHIFNSISKFGNFYRFAIPFAIIGICISIKKLIKSIKNKKFELSCLFLILLLSNIPLILTLFGNTGRLQTAIIALLYFIVLGIQFIYKKTKICFIIILTMYLIITTMFFNYYFNRYEIDNKSINFSDRYFVDVIDRIEAIDKNKDVICRHNTMQSWIYVAYKLQVSPYYLIENRHEKKIHPKLENFGFGKYYFYINKTIEPDENKIYVLRENYIEMDDFFENLEALRNNEFKEEKIGDYYIFYK